MLILGAANLTVTPASSRHPSRPPVASIRENARARRGLSSPWTRFSKGLFRLMDTLEAACIEHRGATAEAMTEGAVQAYLQVKAEQAEASRALYRIAIELDSRGLVEAAIQRAEHAIAAMLATASDGRFSNTRAVARMLFAAIHGTVRMFYEREIPPAIRREIERHLTVMCCSYVTAAIRPKGRA